MMAMEQFCPDPVVRLGPGRTRMGQDLLAKTPVAAKREPNHYPAIWRLEER